MGFASLNPSYRLSLTQHLGESRLQDGIDRGAIHTSAGENNETTPLGIGADRRRSGERACAERNSRSQGHLVGKGQVDRVRQRPASPRLANRQRCAARARHRGDVCGGRTGRPTGLGPLLVAAANTQEPFAWAIASDNKTIMGADVDGYFHITLVSPDRMEKCYVHNGLSPSKSIVATCHTMDRVKR